MYIYSAVSLASETTVSSFIGDYSFIFILALLTFAMAIFLKSLKVFFVQAVLFAATVSIPLFGVNVIGETSLDIWYYIVLILQITLGIFVAYRLKLAVDEFCTLVLEKTHQLPANLTKGAKSGTKSSFL